MDSPKTARRCQLLIGVALVLLTVGTGYDVVFGTQLADFIVIVAGLFTGWIAFFTASADPRFGTDDRTPRSAPATIETILA